MGERSPAVRLQSILLRQTGGQHSTLPAAPTHSAAGWSVSTATGPGPGAGTTGSVGPVPQTLPAVRWQTVPPHATGCGATGQPFSRRLF